MIKIGIVGVGQFGQNHARILQNSNRCEFMGIYDKRINRAKEIAERDGAKNFSSLDELLDCVEALAIVVTTSSHYDIAKKAIERGIHVFIEKPITAELWQAKELITLADNCKVKIQVGHIERFNPVILEIEDKLVNPVFVECHRIAPFSPRGTDIPVVLELMIHDIDFILAFANSKVKDIRANGAGVMTKSIDIANARIEFENGATANVTSSRISQKRSRKMRFFSKNSYFSIDFQEKKAKVVTKSKQLYKVLPKIMMGNYAGIKQEDVVDLMEIQAKENPKDALTTELESFIDSIEKNTIPIVDGHAGTRALDVALQIVEAINKNKM